MRRRDFLALPALMAPAVGSVRLGIRTVVYRDHPMAEAARRVRAAGFRDVHLGLRFADAKFDMAAPDWSYAQRARDAFGQAGVNIAGLDGYVNLMQPDLARRRADIRALARLLEGARRFGTPIVATETGSFHGGRDHPEPEDPVRGWKEFLSAVKELLPAADAGDSILAIEPSYSQCFGNVRDTRRLLDAVPSPRLKILWDAAHLVSREYLGDTRSALERMRDAFGGHVVLAHANDVYAGPGGKPTSMRAGRGVLDYDTYLKLLAGIRPGIALCLEHVTEPEVAAAVEYVKQHDTGHVIAR